MGDDSITGVSRRRYLTVAGGTVSLGLAGCLHGGGGDDAITWVMNPAEQGIDIGTQYRPLFEYLEAEADVTIDPIATQSYSGTIQELRRATDGDAILADVSPGAVAQIPDEIDVVGMRLAFGSELYFSLVTTTPDSGVDSLADAEGERVTTASPTSVSGTLFPMLLFKQAGLDIGGAPDGQPEDFDWRPTDHFTAREQLIQDPEITVAGTGAFSTASHVPKEQFDEMSPDFADISVEYGDAGSREPELQLLGVSDPIPRAPIVANTEWNDDRRESVEELMIEADGEVFQHEPEELADDLGFDLSLLEKDEEELTEDEQEQVNQFEDHQLWFDGVEPATKEDYEPISELAEELGLDWEDL